MDNEFSPGGVEDLEHLRQRAAGLQDMVRGIQDAAPSRTEGADRTGAVRVAVGQDGLPDSIQVEDRWQDSIRPEALGSTITEAAEQAMRRRGETWARILERSGDSAGSGPYSPEAGQEPGAGNDPGLAGARSLGEIAEEVIGMLASVGSSSPGAVQGRGADPDRKIAITLTRSGQVFCAVDARWAAERSSAQLNQALGGALAAAREELRSQSPGNPAPAGRVAQLSAEVRAAVSEDTWSPEARGRNR